MMDVRAGEEARKSPDQSETADRAPADVFDQAVGGIGVGSDHHVAAGEFAVVEGEEEGGFAILCGSFREAMRKREMLSSHEAGEDSEDVAEFAPAFETAVGGFGDVGGEAESEEIQEIEFASGVAETDYVAASGGFLSFSASIVCSMPRLVKSFRKELPVPSGRRPRVGRPWVSASGKRPLMISKEVPSPPTARKLRHAFAGRLGGKRGGFAGAVVGATSSAIPVWRTRCSSWRQVAGFSAACRGIYDGQKVWLHGRERSGAEMARWIIAAPRRNGRDFGGFVRPNRRV